MASNAASKDPSKGLAYAIRDEDLEDLQKLRSQLHDACDQQRQDGRIFMTETYICLIAIIDPMITRIERRFKREGLANQRRELKEMKLDARLKREGSSDA
jgi:hypothetical protein